MANQQTTGLQNTEGGKQVECNFVLHTLLVGTVEDAPALITHMSVNNSIQQSSLSC
jgi:hypothetical protein